MNEALPDDQLFDEAVDLIIRLQNDSDNGVTLETIRRWRLRGEAYERAWTEACEIQGMANRVLTSGRQDDVSMSRRKLLVGAPLLIGSVAAGAYLSGAVAVSPRADFASDTAEFRRVSLFEGSTATLGPDSAIALDSMGDRRGVSLLQGMAYFEVDPGQDRPFSVRAGSVTLTALDAAFDVSNDADFITATVDRGVVSAQGPWHSADAELRLGRGDWVSLDEKQSMNTGKRAARQVAAWRDGVIVAEKEPISAVVARIARWRRGRVVLMSPWLSAQRISGVFDLRDPVIALEAVVQPYGGKVREISPLLAVVSLV